MLRRISDSFVLSFITAGCAAILVMGTGAQLARAVGLVYVDADPVGGNIVPLAAFESPKSDTSNLWGSRADFGANSTVYESGVSENSPELTQTITGLTPGNSYDVYGVYWSDQDENWTVRAGIAPGVNTLYSYTGTSGTSPVAGSTQGLTASLAVWDTPPPAGPAVTGNTPYMERVANPLIMLLGKAGTTVADGSGNLPVYLDDLANSGAVRRSWLDGVAYAPAGTVVAASATLDRATGIVTLNNPTTQNFDIKAIHIESGATGALNASTWNAVHNSNAGWTITTPADPANTPYTNLLEENGGGTTISLAPGGGSISFGNVWNKSPYDHIVIWLTMADDTIAALTPLYTGPTIATTDFNGDGSITLADYQALLSNMQTNVSTLSKVEAFRKGDATGDNVINVSDFLAFRTAYNAAHGAGAFDQLLAQVPEPSSIALVATLGALLAGFRRRCRTPFAFALLICLSSTQASRAADLLDVDINARSNATNTAPGYSVFTLSGTGAQAGGTAVVNGYTVTVTAVNASGTPAGAVDDRVRTTPTGTPSLYQLYQDFIFAGTSTGLGGGMNLQVSGGSLLPNSQYTVSIYSFDQGTTGGRTASWLDGNNGNAVVVNTSFNGSNLPTTNGQYKFTGLATTDATGQLLLRGRSTQSTNVNTVFLDGFEIAVPNELTLEVNTATGATRILNEQSGNFDMIDYEIRSPAGSLTTSGWVALDDTESAPDPVGSGWDRVPASNSNLLNEVNLTSMTTFAPNNSASLGNVFTVGGVRDISFLYAGPNDSSLRTGIVRYVTSAGGVAGDYNGNGVVDAADYVLWRKGGPLQNEGRTTGVIDQQDYLFWRARFGASNGAGSGSSLGNGSEVPEPAMMTIFAVATVIFSLQHRRRQAPHPSQA
jgi:hypothetical protein